MIVGYMYIYIYINSQHLSTNVGKTIINHPQITMFIGDMLTIPSHGWFMTLFSHVFPTWITWLPWNPIIPMWFLCDSHDSQGFLLPRFAKPKRGRAPHAGLPQFAAVALPAAVPEAWSVAPGRSARTIGPLDRWKKSGRKKWPLLTWMKNMMFNDV